jgi:Tfp pilus assembly protein FimT
MTLIELLVILGVIGLILGISVPGLAGYAKRMRLSAVARQAVGLVSLARSLAVSSHADHAVVLDEERAELRVVNAVTGQAHERSVRLPASVTAQVRVGGEAAEEPEVVFRPTGSLSGGRSVSLVLADRDRRHTVTVNGITGSVSLQ